MRPNIQHIQSLVNARAALEAVEKADSGHVHEAYDTPEKWLAVGLKELAAAWEFLDDLKDTNQELTTSQSRELVDYRSLSSMALRLLDAEGVTRGERMAVRNWLKDRATRIVEMLAGEFQGGVKEDG